MKSADGRYPVPTGLMAGPKLLALFAEYGPNYRWFAIFAVMLASFTTLLTGTIINVAIPDIMGTFGMSSDQAQWVSTGYLAATTGFMLLTAWSVEALGMRATYMVSMGIFLAGSLMGGFAPNAEMMIASRIIQGIAAGLVGPLSMLLITQVFPLNKRGMAMGIFSVGVVLAPAMGPTIGGLLVDTFNWQYVFHIQVPLSLLSFPLGLLFMPVREGSGPRTPFDWNGLILLSIFVFVLLTALANGQRHGWNSDYILTLLAISLTAGVAFIAWEHRSSHPMLDLQIFLEPRFAAAAGISFILGAGLFGSTYLVPLFLQTVMGVTPTTAGVLLMPAGLAMAALNPVSGYLSDKIDARFMIWFGLFTFSISSFLLTDIDINTSFFTLIWWVLIGRAGLAAIFPSLNSGALRVLPFRLMSQGSGAVNFLRQLGGAFGVNLLTVALQDRISFYYDAFSSTQTSGNVVTLELLQKVRAMLAASGVPEAQQIPAAVGYLGQMIGSQAATFAYRDAFLLITLVFILTMLPTALLKLDVPGRKVQ